MVQSMKYRVCPNRRLVSDELMEIIDDGKTLQIFDSAGKKLLFELYAPENAGFYSYAKHSIHGECPIVSFNPGNEVNGWMDWYYRVDPNSQTMEQLNPWR
jgi:hypothetical protein